MTNEQYMFWLCGTKGVYRNDISRLLGIFGTAEEIYNCECDELVIKGGLGREQAETLIKGRNPSMISYRMRKLEIDGIRFIPWGSADYPEAFLQLDDFPYAIYVKGNLPDPDLPTAGIVGARTCSAYGREMTVRFSQALCVGGVQIISGMAVGIDSWASKSALLAGGKTFAVLGSGIDVIYPRENIELYYQIIMNGGGIITEYPPGTPPAAWQFPHRNRLISAFSDRLLIMEAKKRSGTMTTAAYSLSMGKEIYALPGRLTDIMSEGCNMLISEGAGILTDPSLLLEEIFRTGGQKCITGAADSEYEIIKKREGLQGNQAKVYDAVGFDPVHTDAIIEKSGLSASEATAALTELSLIGLIEEVTKDCYVLS